MKCIICNSKINGMGHNPQPIFNQGRCCDYCNSDYVYSIRVLQHTNPILAQSALKQYHLQRKINSLGL